MQICSNLIIVQVFYFIFTNRPVKKPNFLCPKDHDYLTFSCNIASLCIVDKIIQVCSNLIIVQGFRIKLATLKLAIQGLRHVMAWESGRPQATRERKWGNVSEHTCC
jgi:hypothetical protein